jgi:hypothetical protein
VVTVTGTGFLNTASSVCRFGSAGFATGTVSVSTLMRCAAPVATSTGVVALVVGHNSQQLSAGSASFTYGKCFTSLVTWLR